MKLALKTKQNKTACMVRMKTVSINAVWCHCLDSILIHQQFSHHCFHTNSTNVTQSGKKASNTSIIKTVLCLQTSKRGWAPPTPRPQSILWEVLHFSIFYTINVCSGWMLGYATNHYFKQFLKMFPITKENQINTLRIILNLFTVLLNLNTAKFVC